MTYEEWYRIDKTPICKVCGNDAEFNYRLKLFGFIINDWFLCKKCLIKQVNK